MKLSILDQVPVSKGKTAQQAMNESIRLAQTGEQLGYERYWIAEHHDLAGLACPAPEVMLGAIGSATETIRIGSGASLLPHYKPFKLAEIFNTLAVLFGDRIDLGIGRAPGGSAEASIALSGNYLEQVRTMPEKAEELLNFLYNEFPQDHMFSKVSASPLPDTPPVPWMLGTSEKSAVLAAKHGMAYAFGYFMSDHDGREALKYYAENFRPGGMRPRPKSIVAVSTLCAETKEKAEETALSLDISNLKAGKGEPRKGIPSVEEAKQYPLQSDDMETIRRARRKTVIGDPQTVRQKLTEIREAHQADELMIVSMAHDFEDRLNSYRLIAETMSE